MSAKRTFNKFKSDNFHSKKTWDEGLKLLEKYTHPKYTFKKTFSVSTHSFTSEETIALKKVIKKMPMVTSISLYFCGFKDENSYFFVDNPHLKSLKFAEAMDNFCGSDFFCEKIISNTIIRSLSLTSFGSNRRSYENLAEALTLNTFLRTFFCNFSFSTYGFFINFFIAIVTHPSIQDVQFAPHWSPLPNDYDCEITNLKFGNLICLNLDGFDFNVFSKLDLFFFLRQVTTLKKLSLEHATLKSATQSFCTFVKRTTTLEELYMKYASLEDSFTVTFFHHITNNNSIKIFEVPKFARLDSNIISLSHAIMHNTVLESIAYNNDDISEIMLTSICEALKSNVSVTDLSIVSEQTHHETESDHESDKTRHPIASLLHVNSTLCKLHLNGFEFDNNFTLDLSEALKVNTTLTHLALINDDIDDTGLISMAEVLTVNTSLMVLDLSCNKIKYHTNILNKALRSNTTLTSLCLYGNEMNSEGISNFVSCIPSLSVLRHLSITLNDETISEIANIYGKAIANLELNESIVSFDIYNVSNYLEVKLFNLNDLRQRRTLFELLFFALYSFYP